MDHIVFQTRGPEWARTVLRADDGTLYLPAAVIGNESAVSLCAMWEGVSAMIHRKHLYFPVEWLMREYPDAREAIEKLRSRLAS